MTEKDILFQRGDYWVSLTPKGHMVWKSGITHATSVCLFPATRDGKSIAIAYAEYLGRKGAVVV